MADEIKTGTVGNSGGLKGMMGDGASDRDILNAVDTSEETDTDTNTEDSNEEAEETDETEETADESAEEETSEDETDDLDKVDDTEEDDTEDDSDKSDNLYQSLKKENPELFKKHPELKAIISRERQYTELLPSVDDAKYVINRANMFGAIEKDIMSGKTEPLMNVLKNSGQSLALFAQDFITKLGKVDKDVYMEIAAVPIKQALRFAFTKAKSSGDKNLAVSVKNLHQFIFEDDDLAADVKFSTAKQEDDPEKLRLHKEIRERDDRQLMLFRNDVGELVDHRLKSQISKSIETLELNPYSRKNVTKDMLDKIDSMLKKDVRYQASMSSLWRQAQSAGFSSDWKNRISNAVSARVKDIILIARKQVLTEAEIEKGKATPKKDTKRIVPGGTATSKFTPGGSIDYSRVDRKATTDRDILSDNPKRLKFVK